MRNTGHTIKIENMQIGRRYVECYEGFETGWTVHTIERKVAPWQPWRDGRFIDVEIARAHYHNGINTGWLEVGTDVHIDCDTEGSMKS